MVCFFSKHRVEERLASWFLASTVRLDRHEDSVDFSQLLWVIATQGPAAIRLVIHVENTQIYGLRSLPLGRFFLPPCLKGVGIFGSCLPVQVKCIKNERLALRVEDATEWFSSATTAVHIEYISNVEIASAHQLADVPVGGKELARAVDLDLQLVIRCGKFIDLRFQRGKTQCPLVTIRPQANEFGLDRIIRMPRFLKLRVECVALLRNGTQLL